MVAGDGIEPPLLAKETSVLPLHYPAAIKDRGAEAYRGTFWWAVLIHAQEFENKNNQQSLDSLPSCPGLERRY